MYPSAQRRHRAAHERYDAPPIAMFPSRVRVVRITAAAAALRGRVTRPNALRVLLEEIGSAVQAKLAFQKGFASLPDDILALVFESFCIGTCPREPLVLSHVCRRFRKIALKLPRIWSTISLTSKRSPELLECFLSRSKNVGLYLKISPGSPEHLLTLITNESLSSRWQTFDFDITKFNLQKKAKIVEFFDQTFSLLESVSLYYDYHLVESYEKLPNPDLSWRMPKLRNLSLYNIIPSSPSENLDHARLLDFLKLSPNLKCLTLRFAHFSFGTPSTTLSNTNVAVLPNLQSFSLEVFGREWALEVFDRERAVDGFRNLMDHMDFPALSKLTATLYLRQSDLVLSTSKPGDEWVDSVLFHYIRGAIERPRYPVLQDLTLVIPRDRTAGLGSPLLNIDKLAPSLKHLTIDVERVVSPQLCWEPCWEGPYPRLRTLTIRGVSLLCVTFVKHLINCRDGMCPETFERLEIAGCWVPDLYILEKALPKEKFCLLERAPRFKPDFRKTFFDFS
ncbi:hypothetical protein DFH11DRAFT_1546236 [Phellopilus nigrolimitatus]|nr:hypothetical protein DFH11DRAFT_1546236 [Phellopilus nigrolimitatus]